MRFGVRFILALLLSWAYLTIPVAAAVPTTVHDKNLSFIYQGVLRTYWLHVPATYQSNNAPVPLVIGLHGMGSSGSSLAAKSGISDKSDKVGFIAVYPDALGNPAMWNWLPTLFQKQPDDIGFIRALIKSVQNNYRIDARRIYVAGHSNGGMMAYRIAADIPNTIAGVAAVAGAIGIRLPGGREITIPRPKGPVPMLIVHGSLDEVIPYHGGSGNDPTLAFLSVAEARAFWVKNNGCNQIPDTEVQANGKLRREVYQKKCKYQVQVITFIEGSHSWPRIPGKQNDLSATDMMWEFFSQQSLPVATSLVGRVWHWFTSLRIHR